MNPEANVVKNSNGFSLKNRINVIENYENNIKKSFTIFKESLYLLSNFDLFEKIPVTLYKSCQLPNCFIFNLKDDRRCADLHRFNNHYLIEIESTNNHLYLFCLNESNDINISIYTIDSLMSKTPNNVCTFDLATIIKSDLLYNNNNLMPLVYVRNTITSLNYSAKSLLDESGIIITYGQRNLIKLYYKKNKSFTSEVVKVEVNGLINYIAYDSYKVYMTIIIIRL